MTKKEVEHKGKERSKANLFGIVRPYGGIVTILVIMALAGSSMSLIIPKLIEGGIDTYGNGTFSAKTIVIQFLLAASGVFLFSFLQDILQTFTAEKVAKNLRNQLADKISMQSYSFVLKANPSKLLTNMTSDMDSVKSFVSQAFVSIISSLFVIVGAAYFLISINWKLALAVLTIVPIIAISFFMVFKKARVLFKKSREVIDALNRTINESILGSTLIRVLNSHKPEAMKFLGFNEKSRDLGIQTVQLFAVLVPIIIFVSNLAIVTILALGGHFVVAGTLSLGEFAAFNSYISMLIFPVMMIGFMSNIISSATVSFNRIQGVLKTAPPEDFGTVADEIRGDIAVQNVNLSYGDKPVLKNISLQIKSGSKTAIIGPTAAGKSQLMCLLADLISPNSGSIRIDGVEVQNYTREALYTQLGIVFQDNVIFNMSLRENIAFSDIVSDEHVEKALEVAELGDFVNTLPNKLDTNISERGTNLSGGQKQRLMLARALALNPKILLLDDFTSRVDRNTEDRILQNIEKSFPDLTLVSVTQKIEPVQNFDQIILIMEGEIVASGKHEELMSSSPEYNQIFNSQKSTDGYEL